MMRVLLTGQARLTARHQPGKLLRPPERRRFVSDWPYGAGEGMSVVTVGRDVEAVT